MQRSHSQSPLVDRLLSLKRPAGLQVSPSAHHVVYSASSVYCKGEHAKSALLLAEVEQAASARPITSGLHDDRDPRWLPDGSAIVFRSDRAKEGEADALYSLPFAAGGGEAVALTKADNQKSIANYSISPDGRLIAFVSADEKSQDQVEREKAGKDAIVYGEHFELGRLRVVDLQSKTVRTLVSDSRHVKEQLAWSPDSSRIVFITSDTPELDARGLRFEALHVQTHQRQRIADWNGMVEELPMYVLHNKLFFLAGVTPDAISTQVALWRLDLVSAQFQLINQHACIKDLRSINGVLAVHFLLASRALAPDGPQEQITLIDPEGETYHAQYTTTKRISSFALMGRRAPVSQDPREQESRCFNHDFSPPLRVIADYQLAASIVSVEGCSTSPDEVYSASLRYEAPGMLLSPPHGGSLQNDFHHRHTKTIMVGSKDQRFKLEGIVFFHADKPRPTVVIVHGGPYYHVKDSWNPGHYYWHEVLFQLGYNVLAPNYRGSAGHGERFAAAASGATGTHDYDDVLSLVQQGIEEGFIDRDRLVVGGWSQGGFLSYLCSVRNGRFLDGSPCGFRFRGAICGAGLCDKDMLTMTSDVPAFQAELAGAAPWTSSSSDVRARAGSAIWELDSATDMPAILILHGKADERVPHSQAVAFHRGCLRKGVSCEFVTYPGEPHQFRKRAHVADMLKRIVKFCEEHLGRPG